MPVEYGKHNLDRLVRGLGQDKGSKIQSVQSPPTRSEGQDGDMQMHNGDLYIKDKYMWHHFISKTSFKIDKIVDNTGGSVNNILSAPAGSTYATDNEVEDYMASLSAKINKIIELLGLDRTS
tara:strand:+ start:1018 stop:1383 length:366 start_codon:yes stop_codon:yes gene_type:complete